LAHALDVLRVSPRPSPRKQGEGIAVPNPLAPPERGEGGARADSGEG